MRVINESSFDQETRMVVPYQYMVDFDHMMWHGWFTGLEPFLDEAKEKQRQVNLARLTGQR